MAFRLIFAGVILSLLKFGRWAKLKCVVISVGDSDGVGVRTAN